MVHTRLTIKAVRYGESPQNTAVLVGALIPRARVPRVTDEQTATSSSGQLTCGNHDPHISYTVQATSRTMMSSTAQTVKPEYLPFNQSPIMFIHPSMMNSDPTAQRRTAASDDRSDTMPFVSLHETPQASERRDGRESPQDASEGFLKRQLLTCG